MKKSHLVAAGAAATAAAAASVLGAAYGIYRIWFYHSAEPEDTDAEELSKTLPYGAQLKKDAEALEAAPYEPVQITADDGTLLAARYYHHADGAPLAIIFTGTRGLPAGTAWAATRCASVWATTCCCPTSAVTAPAGDTPSPWG